MNDDKKSDGKESIDPAVVEKLEISKRAVLRRVAESLKSQINEGNEGSVSASHTSHASSNTGRTHASTVTS